MKLSGAKKVMFFASLTIISLIALSLAVSADPACFQDSDCGFTGFFGTEQCSINIGNSVFKNFQNSTCLNPGTEESVCSITQEPLEINSCEFACFEGTCIICDSNLDCSDSNDLTIDLCLQPGTLESRCSNTLNDTALMIDNIETNPELPHTTNFSDLNISLNFTSNRYPIDLQFILSKNSTIIDVSELMSILNPEDLPAIYQAQDLIENMTYQLSFNVSDGLGNSLEFFLGNLSRSSPEPSDPIFLEIISPESREYDSNVISINISSNSENITFFNGSNFIPYTGETTLAYTEGVHILTAKATNSTSIIEKTVSFSIDIPSSGGGGGSSSSGGQILRLPNKTEPEEIVYFIPTKENITQDTIFLESQTIKENKNILSNNYLQFTLVLLSALLLFIILLMLTSKN